LGSKEPIKKSFLKGGSKELSFSLIGEGEINCPGKEREYEPKT